MPDDVAHADTGVGRRLAGLVGRRRAGLPAGTSRPGPPPPVGAPLAAGRPSRLGVAPVARPRPSWVGPVGLPGGPSRTAARLVETWRPPCVGTRPSSRMGPRPTAVGAPQGAVATSPTPTAPVGTLRTTTGGTAGPGGRPWAPPRHATPPATPSLGAAVTALGAGDPGRVVAVADASVTRHPEADNSQILHLLTASSDAKEAKNQHASSLQYGLLRDVWRKL